MANKRGVEGTSPGQQQKRGSDGPWHESEGGVMFAPEGFANDSGLGTPPEPKMRGNTDPIGSGQLPSGGSARKNGVLDSFFMDKGGK